MTIDLDALEKLADVLRRQAQGAAQQNANGAMEWEPSEKLIQIPIDAAATIKALTAELKEARGHLERCVQVFPVMGALDAAEAFLARNGKGEEKEVIHPRNAPRGLSDEC